MRVFLRPTGTYSPAMVRIANALTRHLPAGFSIAGTPSPRYADLVVLYVIGMDANERIALSSHYDGQLYAVVQCCLDTAGDSSRTDDYEAWHELWQNAECVWSYYDLVDIAARHSFNFFHAPLGLDDAFLDTQTSRPIRENLVLTTGHVHGYGAEAIEEVWKAAWSMGVKTIHVGPQKVVGVSADSMRYMFDNGMVATSISDDQLADLYRRAAWVSALRYGEGFELPAAEGLSCGARPIMFDQPTIRDWYGDTPEYVADTLSGDALISRLTSILTWETARVPVPFTERVDARNRFNWEPICAQFWSRVTDSIAARQAGQKVVVSHG